MTGKKCCRSLPIQLTHGLLHGEINQAACFTVAQLPLERPHLTSELLMLSQEMEICRACFTSHRPMTFPKPNTKSDALMWGQACLGIAQSKKPVEYGEGCCLQRALLLICVPEISAGWLKGKLIFARERYYQFTHVSKQIVRERGGGTICNIFEFATTFKLKVRCKAKSWPFSQVNMMLYLFKHLLSFASQGKSYTEQLIKEHLAFQKQAFTM